MNSKKFEKLTPSEKRVAVAKDVILQLDSKTYVPEVGDYVRIYRKSSLGISYPSEVDEIKCNTEEDVKSTITGETGIICAVCVIGSLVLSATRFVNILTFGDIHWRAFTTSGNKNLKNVLGGIFTPKQLLLMETAYEGYHKNAKRVAKKLFDQEELSKEEIENCDAFKDYYATDDRRLRAIMQIIVENDGKFSLKKWKSYA